MNILYIITGVSLLANIVIAIVNENISSLLGWVCAMVWFVGYLRK